MSTQRWRLYGKVYETARDYDARNYHYAHDVVEANTSLEAERMVAARYFSYSLVSSETATFGRTPLEAADALQYTAYRLQSAPWQTVAHTLRRMVVCGDSIEHIEAFSIARRDFYHTAYAIPEYRSYYAAYKHFVDLLYGERVGNEGRQ